MQNQNDQTKVVFETGEFEARDPWAPYLKGKNKQVNK